MFNENGRVLKIDQYDEYQFLITNVIYAAGLNLGDKHFVKFETIYFDFSRVWVDLEPENWSFARARVDLELGNLVSARAGVDLDPENSSRFRTLAPSGSKRFQVVKIQSGIPS